MEWTSPYGRKIYLDASLWQLSANSECGVVDEDENSYTIVNENGISVPIPVGIFRDNHLMVQNGKINLPTDIYTHWVLKPHRERADKVFNDIFNENVALILDHPEIVLSRAEYFFLRPFSFYFLFKSKGNHIHISLGSMLESFLSGNHIYFDTLGGHKKMYLIHVAGSYFSGSCSGLFWSAESRSMVHFPSNDMPRIPGGFGQNRLFLEKLARQDAHIRLDFQDRALQQLLAEIQSQSIG